MDLRGQVGIRLEEMPCDFELNGERLASAPIPLDPPLDEVEIDCDLKLPGREAELAGALAGGADVGRRAVRADSRDAGR